MGTFARTTFYDNYIIIDCCSRLIDALSIAQIVTKLAVLIKNRREVPDLRFDLLSQFFKKGVKHWDILYDLIMRYQVCFSLSRNDAILTDEQN